MIPAFSPKRESKVPIDGYELELAMQSIAPSTISAPASMHLNIEKAPVPAVSWVWMWITKSGYYALIAPIKTVAASGLRRPAISLIPSMSIPCSTNCWVNFI